MKNLIIAAIALTLVSCASQQPANNGPWGKWDSENYVRNEYQSVEQQRTCPDCSRTVVPMDIMVGWSK